MMIFKVRNYSKFIILTAISSFLIIIFFSFSLLFFILKIDGNKGFNVYLPESDSYIFKDIEKSPDLLLSVDLNGTIFINNIQTEPDNIITNIDLITGGKKDSIIKIEMDKSLRYQDVIDLTNFLKYNNYRNLIFITD